MARFRTTAAFSAILAAVPVLAQPPSATTGTPLWIRTQNVIPQKLGQPVRARLTYDIYRDNHLLLPAGTLVLGKIVALQPDHSHRVQARLRGDFTPFTRPVIEFTSLADAHGDTEPLVATPAQDGSPTLQLTRSHSGAGGLIHTEIAATLQIAKDAIHIVTAPGKRHRLARFFYSQLPYHPQSIEPGTAWVIEAQSPLQPLSDTAPAQAAKPQLPPSKPAGALRIEAALDSTLSSASDPTGTTFAATVMQPVYGEKGKLVIPQGAHLSGVVTRSKPARSFGRAGQLRFNFTQLTLPGQTNSTNVQTNLDAIDSTSNLQLDREGNPRPKPKDKVLVPLLLFGLAGRPLDRDGGRNAFGKDAVASNSLGLAGFILGTAAGEPNIAAGIGYYGTALALWNRWIKTGTNVCFPRYTRLVLDTTIRREAQLTSTSTR